MRLSAACLHANMRAHSRVPRSELVEEKGLAYAVWLRQLQLGPTEYVNGKNTCLRAVMVGHHFLYAQAKERNFNMT